MATLWRESLSKPEKRFRALENTEKFVQSADHYLLDANIKQRNYELRSRHSLNELQFT